MSTKAYQITTGLAKISRTEAYSRPQQCTKRTCDNRQKGAGSIIADLESAKTGVNASIFTKKGR